MRDFMAWVAIALNFVVGVETIIAWIERPRKVAYGGDDMEWTNVVGIEEYTHFGIFADGALVASGRLNSALTPNVARCPLCGEPSHTTDCPDLGIPTRSVS